MYLYFEYQCIDTATSFNKRCVLLPDKTTNLTVTNITSRSVQIFWADPENTGDDRGRAAVLIGFLIKLKKGNALIRNVTTDKVNKRKLTNLTPCTTYEISVAAKNKHGFGEETIASLMTSEEAPSGPPVNIKSTSRSASSLSFTWDSPEKDKQNGVIISYTACVSHSENGPCLEIFTTSKREWIVRNLNASTKYYVRVLATNKAGSSAYSGSKAFFMNGRAAKKATEVTSSTLTFSLEIPSKTFLYFYVVALKLKGGKEPASSDSYENSELVKYAEARKSTNPKSYIAAVVASSGVHRNMFILGDGRNTSDPTSRRRRSISSDYYNGPLEPGTSYSVFQRIALNDKSEYYSTDWSPPSKTNEYTGGPHVLTKMSSGDIKAKEGDLVNLMCSAQGEPPITFSWEKDQKPLDSIVEIEKPHRSSFLVVTVEDQSSFGKYICHIRDRFQSTTYTIWVQKLEDIGNDKNDDGSDKYLAGIIVLAILLIISVVINIAYFIYQNRRHKSSKANPENESRDRNNSKDIYENPDKIKDDANYEQVESEQSTYTALKRTGKDENDDHLYGHLNEVHEDSVNQKETGM
ncbi:receptor-type tyrosine- phosphatase S-like isoform X2 [Paramuricea clavata]|uniref:Receptor-type tyrosine- phosphatase S-like isoform X2 n=1 Tax=Paramuricea clavata TaxID=317549 RepID=A0A7D9DPE2_PARCT|nr:receptor-type tyrosine- phosphatase S-like isoform X2 [Paramuricea clavata]